MDENTEHQPPKEESLKESPEEFAERIGNQSREWHDQFDREIWGEKLSFHNWKHVEAVEKAGTLLIEAVIKGHDPLGLKEHIDRWNKDNPEAQIKSLEDFATIYRIAVYCHDNGNIIRQLDFSDGHCSPIYLDGYTADNAENRSIEIATALIDMSSLTNEDKTRLKKIVAHLIEQTRFGYDKNDSEGKLPFAKLMRVADQIGNDFFSTNEERVWGLLEEQLGEKPDSQIDPHYFFNFVLERFPQLVKDENIRNQILQIWGVSMPKERLNLPQGIPLSKDKVPVANFIKLRQKY